MKTYREMIDLDDSVKMTSRYVYQPSYNCPSCKEDCGVGMRVSVPVGYFNIRKNTNPSTTYFCNICKFSSNERFEYINFVNNRIDKIDNILNGIS